MITLDSIFENIIAELVVSAFSLLVSIFIPKLLRKEAEDKNAFKVDPLSIAIFLSLISIINLIFNLSFWNNQNLTILFTLSSVLFGYFTYYVYENQCPSCKRFIKAKKKIDEKTLKEYTKEIPYQPQRIIKYSNGRIKKREPWGKKKIRIEKWERVQRFYECNFCQYKWDSGQIDIPIFIEKESHKVINTNEKDPEEPSFN